MFAFFIYLRFEGDVCEFLCAIDRVCDNPNGLRNLCQNFTLQGCCFLISVLCSSLQMHEKVAIKLV